MASEVIYDSQGNARQVTRVAVTTEAYRTTDGVLCSDKEAAEKHQMQLDLKDGLSYVVDRFAFHDMQAYDIVEGLVDHIEDLEKVVRAYQLRKKQYGT